VRAIVERFVNTRPSATEAETMQSADGFLFAVAGVEDIGADGSFINDPALQLMVHALIDPMRAEILLDAANAIEARLAGVATPATPVHVDSIYIDDEDEEDEDDEEFGPVHWYHHAEEAEEEEEEGFVDDGGIHGEEDEGEEDGDMDSPIANEEDGGMEGVTRKSLQFDEEPSAKKTKFMAAQLNSLKKAMNDHQIEEADDPDVGEQNAAEQSDAEHNADMDEHCVAQPEVASIDEHD
jgi:hypothetical protein